MARLAGGGCAYPHGPARPRSTAHLQRPLPYHATLQQLAEPATRTLLQARPGHHPNMWSPPDPGSRKLSLSGPIGCPGRAGFAPGNTGNTGPVALALPGKTGWNRGRGMPPRGWLKVGYMPGLPRPKGSRSPLPNAKGFSGSDHRPPPGSPNVAWPDRRMLGQHV